MVIFRFCHGDRDSYPCRPSFRLCSVLHSREVFRLRVCTELLSTRKYFRSSFMATLLRSKEWKQVEHLDTEIMATDNLLR